MRAPLRLAVALGLWAAPAAAQVAPPRVTYAVDAWTTADGLPQSNVGGLGMDSEGYLWLVTALGVTRFDGDSFVDYPRRAEPGRPQQARALTTDGQGRLWFLRPWTQVARVEAGGRIVERTTDLMPDDPRSLVVGPGETVWLATGFEVWRLDGFAWRPVPTGGGVGHIRVMRRDRHGVLWIGGPRGLLRLVGDRPERVTGLRCGEIWDVSFEPQGTLVSTCAGVEYLPKDGGMAELAVARPSPGLLLRIADTLWTAGLTGVERMELARRTNGIWAARTTFTDDLDTRHVAPTAMIADGAGGVWIATDGSGLRRVRPLPGRRITLADGLPARATHIVAPDGGDGLWIGSCAGIAHWRDGRLVATDTAALGLDGHCVHGLMRDRTGALWVGQTRLLLRAAPGERAAVVLRIDGTHAEEVFPLLEDRRGRLWFGTSLGGVGYVAGPAGEPVLLRAGVLPSERVWSAVEDAEGDIWIGQSGWISRLKGDSLVARLGEEDGVPESPVRGMLVDSNGDLWLATYGSGLVRYRAGEGIARVPSSGRRFDRMLSSIGQARDGRLWMHGDGGLTVMSREALEEAVATGRPVRGAVTLGARDGVPEGNGGYRSAWLDEAAQRVWFATVDGVVAVDLAPTARHEPPLHVRIDDLRLDGRSIAVGDTLIVPPSVSAVEIWFSSPALGAAGTTLLRYQLEGHDRRWVDAGAPPVARYANLAPGRYRFAVTAERVGSATPSATQAITVVVKPAWWETPLARAVQLVLVLGTVLGLVRLRTRTIRERNRILRREITERKRAERQAAEAARELVHASRLATAGELATSIAHELNQPLAAVMGSAQKARRLADAGREAELAPTLDLVVDQAERAAGVIRSLRAFVLKQESWDQVDPDHMVAGTLRLLQQELTSRGVAVEVHDERTRRATIVGSEVQLQQVLVNLLLNAADAMASLRAGQARATILLRDEEPGMLRISVLDAGPGLGPEVMTRMFNPFFSSKATGLGLGLSLSRSIVESHSGRLWAENAPHGGAVVHVLLPVVTP